MTCSRDTMLFAARTLISVTIAVFIYTGLFAFQNEPDGYNGIVWGADISGLENMKLTGVKPRVPEVKVYVREGDTLRFGDVELKSIEYEFRDGKFVSTVLKVNTFARYVELKKEAFSRFGPGIDATPLAEWFLWNGAQSEIYLVAAFDIS